MRPTWSRSTGRWSHVNDSARAATLMTVGSAGVVLVLGLTSFDYSVSRSVFTALFVASIVWLTVYLVERRGESAKESRKS